MKRISVVLIAGMALAATGCGLMKATGVMTDPPPNTVVSLQVDGAKTLRDSDTIVVPTLYLRLPVEGKASASSQDSALNDVGRRGSSGRAHAIARYKVAGLDKALAQELAKAAYEDFVGKLRASGYKVLTYDDVKGQEFVADLGLYSKDSAYDMAVEDGSLVATPTDAQAIKPGLGGAVIAPYQRFGKSRFKEGTILIPSYTVVSPLAKTDSNSSGASVQLLPGMAMTNASVAILTNGGAWGGMKLRKWVFGLSDKTGDVVKTADTSPNVANAIGKTLSLLSGVGGTNTKSGAYTLTIDRAAYREGVMKAVTQFNDEAAKAAAGAKKS